MNCSDPIPVMASYTSSNTEPERWAKIVAGADSGRHPEIMIDDGKLVAVSIPSIANARIQSFLADVFKDGDNEWFRPDSDPVESTAEKAADDGQPGSSEKKKISLTQQRANARQEKKDKGQVKVRAELNKENFTPQEWATINMKIGTMRPSGVYREGGKVVATHNNNVDEARNNLHSFVAYALGQYPKGSKNVYERGSGLATLRQ